MANPHAASDLIEPTGFSFATQANNLQDLIRQARVRGFTHEEQTSLDDLRHTVCLTSIVFAAACQSKLPFVITED